MSFIGDGDDSALTYFKVLHSGGLVVRSEPNLTSQSTGRVISCDSIVTTRKNLWKDGDNFFIEVSEGGWVVVKRGVLNACARISGPDIKIGEWSYEVIHPSGSRFAKSPNISEASDRYDRVHQKGTVIKAIRKRTDIGSVITMVQLEADCGWIFEHASTGQVLDRLGNELVVIPIDNSREFRLVLSPLHPAISAWLYNLPSFRSYKYLTYIMLYVQTKRFSGTGYKFRWCKHFDDAYRDICVEGSSRER